MSRMLTGNSDADLHALLAEDEATRNYRAGDPSCIEIWKSYACSTTYVFP
jgi:hypothetical protein